VGSQDVATDGVEVPGRDAGNGSSTHFVARLGYDRTDPTQPIDIVIAIHRHDRGVARSRRAANRRFSFSRRSTVIVLAGAALVAPAVR
jgi:hypothetical protein